MNNRLAVAGLVALVSLTLIAAYLVGRAYLGNATDGDWLNFAGAVFGFMGAILIALWIPYFQIRSRDRLARARISETAKLMIHVFDFSEWPSATHARGAWEGVMVALERLAFERERMTYITHDQFLILRAVERAIQRMNDQFTQNPDLLNPSTCKEELEVDRDLVVTWLGKLDTLLAD